jgi:hypothetical protein
METIILWILHNSRCTQITTAEDQNILTESFFFNPFFKHAYKKLQKYEHGEVASNVIAHLYFLMEIDLLRQYNLPK